MKTMIENVPPQRGKILVIDDDRVLATAMSRILRGHVVTICENGSEALRRLTSGEPYDMIICDLMMPEMTGMDLHAALTSSMPSCLERMIFMTGGAFTPSARAFLDNVSNEQIDKPFDVRKVRELVQKVLSVAA